jgi:hypothetical protein
MQAEANYPTILKDLTAKIECARESVDEARIELDAARSAECSANWHRASHDRCVEDRP